MDRYLCRKMTRKFTGIVEVLVLFVVIVHSGTVPAYGQDALTILFYNTENFFDPFDDSLTLDDAFTPEGDHHWTFARFQKKSHHLYKLFMAVGEHLSGWDPPAMIALAEVENGYVLHYLLHETPFRSFDYGVVHYDSPDRRGIDVALLYDRRRIGVLDSRPLPVRFQGDTVSHTRDILYVQVRTAATDTLALFINHWPSRRGGYLASAPRRMAAARVLAAALDTLAGFSGRGRVVVAGDFNDEPDDPSVVFLAGGTEDKRSLENMMLPLLKKGRGTLWYDGRWWLFDQFLVSPQLAGGRSSVEILRLPFLFDPQQEGVPWRTYAGLHYRGGFSDHLPLVLTIRPEGAGD